jgi:polysaccharide biosynthesis/export protein
MRCFNSSRRAASWRFLVSIGALTGLAACASTGPFTWYTALPRTEWGEMSGEYVIAVGDSIRIQVYQQDALNVTAKIRSDGRIGMPFIREIVAVGKHPSQLAAELENRLKEFIVSPRVTVNIESSQPTVVTVLGEAGHVGLLTLERPAGLLQALAQSGGLTDFADKDKIFVLRRLPQFRRIRFTYDDLLQNKDDAANFALQTGDVVVVE